MFKPTPPPPLLPSGGWNRTYRLGRLLGLTITADTSAFLAALVFWAVIAVIGKNSLGLTGPDVVVGGGLLVLLHYGSGLVHQLGHAIAAAQTRHEMTGIHFWLLLTRSIYPANEPPLPGRVHIQRAKGGPTASAIASAVLAVLTLLLIPVGGLVLEIVAFIFLDNLLFFTLGSFLPFSFTDGGTFKEWRGKP